MKDEFKQYPGILISPDMFPEIFEDDEEVDRRSLFDTKPGEVRYLSWDEDRAIKVTGLRNGGLKAEEYGCGPKKPAGFIFNIAVRADSDGLEFISPRMFKRLVKQKRYAAKRKNTGRR